MPRCASGQEVSASPSSAASTWKHSDSSVCTKGMNVAADKRPPSFSPSGRYSLCRAPVCWIYMILFTSKRVLFYLYFFPTVVIPPNKKTSPRELQGNSSSPKTEEKEEQIGFPSPAVQNGSNKDPSLHTPHITADYSVIMQHRYFITWKHLNSAGTPEPYKELQSATSY